MKDIFITTFIAQSTDYVSMYKGEIKNDNCRFNTRADVSAKNNNWVSRKKVGITI